MFKMIGGDGREYGPISTEQLQQWIAEQRANGQTMVQREGTTGWLPLSALPEFAEALNTAWPGQPAIPPAAPPPLTAAPDFAHRYDQPAAVGSVDVAGCLGRGWALLGHRAPTVLGASALVWLISSGTAFIPCAGPFISLAISGPLLAGLALVFLRLIRGQPTTIGEIFAGFGPAFAALLLIHVIVTLASSIGLVFCIIPGLILKAIWVFALPLALDRGLAFWPAMEASRKAVASHFVSVAALLCVAWLPVLVFESYAIWRTTAFMMDVLGPMGMWSLETLREQLEPFGAFAFKLEWQRQIVLLLNLPFAMAAVMHGYESLFGTRRPEGD